MRRTAQGKELELILTVKMETRHLVEAILVVSFGRSVIIAELWRPEVDRSENFVCNVAFLAKQPLTVKFSTFSSESFNRRIDQRFIQIS